MSTARIIGLFPHPDDEAYAAGGTLALCALAGADVRLVSATRGEAGRDRRTGQGPGSALGRTRSAELSGSCAALGVEAPRFLDLPDGHLASLDVEEICEVLDPMLDSLGPSLVITLGRDGVYGHVDHIACTNAVDRACGRLGGEVRVLHTAFPTGLFVPLWRALGRRRGPCLTAPMPAHAFGIDRAQADVVIPIRSVRAQKLAAIGAHASQLVDGDPLTFMKTGLVGHLLDEEWFTVAAGPPLDRSIQDPIARLWS